MIEIQNNKILFAGKELIFDNKIIEVAEYEGNCRAIDFYGRRFKDNMNIIDKKSHNELINILNELITTIELMRTEKKDYLLNQNLEEAKEWLKFLCEHTDKEELKTLEDEIANRFVFKFDVEIDTGELDGRRVSLMKEYLIKSNEFLK